MEDKTAGTNTVAVASALLIGLGAGGALALLFAPCSGVETRNHIKDGVAKGKKRVEEATGDFRQRASELVDNGKQFVSDNKQRITSEIDRIGAAIEAGRRTYHREANDQTVAAFEEVNL